MHILGEIPAFRRTREENPWIERHPQRYVDDAGVPTETAKSWLDEMALDIETAASNSEADVKPRYIRGQLSICGDFFHAFAEHLERQAERTRPRP